MHNSTTILGESRSLRRRLHRKYAIKLIRQGGSLVVDESTELVEEPP